MDVIQRAANCQSLHVILSDNAANVRPEAVFQFRGDHRKAFLGAERAMHEIAHILVWHRESPFNLNQ